MVEVENPKDSKTVNRIVEEAWIETVKEAEEVVSTPNPIKEGTVPTNLINMEAVTLTL